MENVERVKKRGEEEKKVEEGGRGLVDGECGRTGGERLRGEAGGRRGRGGGWWRNWGESGL